MSAHETAEAILLVVKRIAKWLFFGALLVMAVIVSLYGGKILRDKYEDRPGLVTSIGNVTVGDKLTDVLFREPDFKQEIDYQELKKSSVDSSEPSSSAAGPATTAKRSIVFLMNVRMPDGTLIKNVPEGTTRAQLVETLRDNGYDVSGLDATSTAALGKTIPSARDASSFSTLDIKVEKAKTIYESKNSSRAIVVERGYVTRIGYGCKEDTDYTSVGGIRCGASGELILDRFKNAAKVQCLRDISSPSYVRHRVYDVEKYGIRYHLLSNRVVEFNVMAPSILAAATGVTWGNCE